MKIVVFTDTFYPQTNGVVTYLQDSLPLLAKKHTVVLFAPKGPVPDPAASSSAVGAAAGRGGIDSGITVHLIPSIPFPFYDGYRISSFNYRRVSKLLKKEAPDVIHVHAPVILGVQGMIWAKRHKVPVVATYHTHFPDYLPYIINGADGKLPGFFPGFIRHALKRTGVGALKSLIKQVFKHADITTAPTNELVKELGSYGLENVVYLPNGVDFSKFQKFAPGNAELKAFAVRHGLVGKKVILYVGRVSFEKKLDVLLAAFKEVELKRKDCILLIVGGGPYIKTLKAYAKSIGVRNVAFAGFIKDPAIAYCSADLFVSASDSETFGLTQVEAMYFGLPVVGVRKLGVAEVVVDGKSGLLVDPGDVAGIAGSILALLSDPALMARISKAARLRAAQYSIDKSVAHTLAIYRKLLGR